MRRETRMFFQERRPDGEWETLGPFTINDREASQIVIILAGLDLATFLSLPVTSQERAIRKIRAGESPAMAMD